jgi:2,3-bisphosphoglycerate-independent phosphoglycerate mutase
MNLPICLIIMDGFGIDAPSRANAITQAKTPNLDKLFNNNVTTQLNASGEDVGLPHGQMGNSEVGHLNIGAGRVVYQELTRINHACEDKTLFDNSVLKDAFKSACGCDSAVHLMGLLSDGGVHSHINHLYALIDMAANMNVENVFVHCFMDGRDVSPKSGKSYIDSLQNYIDNTNEYCLRNSLNTKVKIASIQGRYYVMDRDNRWDRVHRGYTALVEACPYKDIKPSQAMLDSYDNNITDEFVEPVALDNRGIKDGDSVVFFNFRPDRAREITKAIMNDNFSEFDVSKRPKVNFVCFTEYDSSFNLPIAFPKEYPDNVLADVIADNGLVQLHTAETEKYAHVTFFLNGGREEPKKNEKRVLINSPKVATYDLQPEMSEPEVTKSLVESISKDEADVYIVNFANCDMVGHTGVLDAAIKAVEAVDEGVGYVIDAISKKGGIVLVTADHGNADKMINKDGTPHTAHTTAPVPFVLFDASNHGLKLKNQMGALCDIAPTLLDVIGIDKPKEMSGKSLLDRD